LLGDHSQPVPWQWTHTEEVGELNPGHTWTALAILGGAKFAPPPGRDDRAVSHVDLGPTILSAINLRHKNHFFGRDLLQGTEERTVWAFRYGTISREAADLREIFRVDSSSSEGLAYRFDRSEVASYGALPGGKRTRQNPSSDLDRHRDVARAWSTLLTDDRLTD
jgi:phosphoglycerol transferase MdoB-like AlkP superfamily enzyme